MCKGAGKTPRKPAGLWVAEGEGVDDVRAVYRFAGVEDLGARSKGRGAGSTARSAASASRKAREPPSNAPAGLRYSTAEMSYERMEHLSTCACLP